MYELVRFLKFFYLFVWNCELVADVELEFWGAKDFHSLAEPSLLVRFKVIYLRNLWENVLLFGYQNVLISLDLLFLFFGIFVADFDFYDETGAHNGLLVHLVPIWCVLILIENAHHQLFLWFLSWQNVIDIYFSIEVV